MRFLGSRISSQIICLCLRRGDVCAGWVYPLLQKENDELKEGARSSVAKDSASVVGPWRHEGRLIKTRCLVFSTVRHAVCCWPTYEFDSAIGCWTSWFSPELWRLMLLISHPASTPQKGVDGDNACFTMIKYSSLWDSGTAEYRIYQSLLALCYNKNNSSQMALFVFVEMPANTSSAGCTVYMDIAHKFSVLFYFFGLKKKDLTAGNNAHIVNIFRQWISWIIGRCTKSVWVACSTYKWFFSSILFFSSVFVPLTKTWNNCPIKLINIYSCTFIIWPIM